MIFVIFETELAPDDRATFDGCDRRGESGAAGHARL